MGQTDFSPRVEGNSKGTSKTNYVMFNQHNMDDYEHNKNLCELFNNLHEHKFVVYSWEGLITGYIVNLMITTNLITGTSIIGLMDRHPN